VEGSEPGKGDWKIRGALGLLLITLLVVMPPEQV
jgi:hypothetical protein